MDVGRINHFIHLDRSSAAQSFLLEKKISQAKAKVFSNNVDESQKITAMADLQKSKAQLKSGNVSAAQSSLAAAEQKIAKSQKTNQIAETDANNEKDDSGNIDKELDIVGKVDDDESRSYSDNSTDMGASMQAPTRLTPAQANLVVPVHENGHILHRKAMAALEGKSFEGKVIIHRRWDPALGQFVVAGGKAISTMKEKSKPQIDMVKVSENTMKRIYENKSNQNKLDISA